MEGHGAGAVVGAHRLPQVARGMPTKSALQRAGERPEADRSTMLVRAATSSPRRTSDARTGAPVQYAAPSGAGSGTPARPAPAWARRRRGRALGVPTTRGPWRTRADRRTSAPAGWAPDRSSDARRTSGA
jgi:hypothetical protein